MKIKGSELLDWMNTDWPGHGDDFCWEHDCFDSEPELDAVYDTSEFSISYQGDGEDPTGGEGYDLGKLIRAWRKRRSFDVLTVTVPKHLTEIVIRTLKEIGASVK
jgi:hypothetical protein